MGEAYPVKMPQLSDTMTEGVMASWEKDIGSRIERGDIVATVETDKAIMDVEVFRGGYLSGPCVSVGSEIQVGGHIAYIVESPEEVVYDEPSPQKPIADSEPGSLEKKPEQAVAVEQVGEEVVPVARIDNKLVTPYARKLSADMGIDLNLVEGTGPEGIITAEDLLKTQPVKRPAEVVSERPVYDMAEIQVAGEGRPMSVMERAVSRSMTAALTMPTFHVTQNVRPEKLITAAKNRGISITIAIAKAAALSIADHPRINWAYQPVEKIVERDSVDIGIAVLTVDHGLVVPVLRDCGRKSLKELDKNWREVVIRARQRRLSVAEYANPTFMISNMGMLGISQFDAIPTPGMAAVLAVASLGDQGMPVTITVDHRVINGAEAGAFMNTLKEKIERPETWFGTLKPEIPKGEWNYDVLVIGAGPGGQECARYLAERKMSVAMVNMMRLPGGECLWYGCIPSKIWREAANIIRNQAKDKRLGIENTDSAVLNWKKLLEIRDRIVVERAELAQKTNTILKITTIHGSAQFIDDHTVLVNIAESGDAEAGIEQADAREARIGFGCAVIATGAPPFIPPVKGMHTCLANGGLLTAYSVFKLEEVPKKLVVIGGGAIGVEMAQMFQDFGAEVTLLESEDALLSAIDPEIAGAITSLLNNDPRLTVKTGVTISEVSGEPGEMLVSFEDSNKEHVEIISDYVLVATGKKAMPKYLQLEKVGVDVAQAAIKVDKRCRSSKANIFAVGDVVGGPMLAHTAAFQGRVAAATIMGEDAEYQESKDSCVIFTRPQVASAGLTLDQARDKNIDAVEIKTPISLEATAMITGATDGMIKIVADKKNHRIVGVHLLADHADALIGEAVLIVSAGLTLEQVANAIHPHPTQSEMLGDMARRLLYRLKRASV